VNKRVYLDYAAATPMDPEVLKAMQPYFTNKFYNPSATYLASKAIRHELDNARAAVAGWLGTRPSEIYFTAGATEANNTAIKGIMSQFPDGDILVSSIEHDSILEPAKAYTNKEIPVDKHGVILLQQLEKLITNKTVLISVMFVNNELGTVQPLKGIAAIIAQVRKDRLSKGNKRPLYLHTDAAQAGNLFDLHVSRLGVDMMSINGGKIYGPKQTGALFIRSGIEVMPLIVGGGQERNLRSGTENVPGFVGFSRALHIAQLDRDKEVKRLKELRQLFINSFSENIPSAIVNGSSKHQAPHILHVTLPGVDNERLMMELDEAGVECAVGSACSASNMKPSHVLGAIGLSDGLARSSLRFSFGRPTKKKDITQTVKTITRIIGN
jgi:cysteine desulfurase